VGNLSHDRHLPKKSPQGIAHDIRVAFTEQMSGGRLSVQVTPFFFQQSRNSMYSGILFIQTPWDQGVSETFFHIIWEWKPHKYIMWFLFSILNGQKRDSSAAILLYTCDVSYRLIHLPNGVQVLELSITRWPDKRSLTYFSLLYKKVCQFSTHTEIKYQIQ